jgi:hypothetical protein
MTIISVHYMRFRRIANRIKRQSYRFLNIIMHEHNINIGIHDDIYSITIIIIQLHPSQMFMPVALSLLLLDYSYITVDNTIIVSFDIYLVS